MRIGSGVHRIACSTENARHKRSMEVGHGERSQASDHRIPEMGRCPAASVVEAPTGLEQHCPLNCAWEDAITEDLIEARRRRATGADRARLRQLAEAGVAPRHIRSLSPAWRSIVAAAASPQAKHSVEGDPVSVIRPRHL